MANTVSAAKRARQSERRRVRNAALKSRLRTITKRFLHSLDPKSGEKAQAPEFLAAAVKEWDKAWSKGVVKRRTASRHISRLNLTWNKFQAGAPSA